jgi:peptide/nickel transport system substrate-binding protein
MKPDIRWQLLLAVTGLGLVLLLLSLQPQSAAVCTTRIPSGGGTFVEGMIGRPLTMNPLLSDPYPVDRHIANLVFDGLVRFDETGNILPALAEEWSISEDGLTVTFTLRPDALWHDGRPVTTRDVAFTYGLIQDEAFPGPERLRTFWQAVTIMEIDEQTIQFTLPQPYGPIFLAVARGILPAHELEDTPAAELAESPFNLAPIGTGPFRVPAGQDWAQAGFLRLAPNPDYWPDGTQLSDIELRFFPDAESLLVAYESGELHAANGFPSTMLPRLAERDDTRIFTSVVPRYTSLLFNIGETGSAPLKPKEARQALAFVLDRSRLIDTILNGQGVEFDGPYIPDSWAARPALMTSYSYQPETAAALLDGIGLTMGESGLRQIDGQALTFRLLSMDSPDERAIAEEIARQWRELGIEVQIEYAADTVEFRQALRDRSFDVALTEVLAPPDPDLYDFWSQEAIVRGQNYGGWNSRRASEALETARQLYPPDARAPHYESFLRQFDGDLPALTLYQHVDVYALNNAVQQAEIGRVWEPRDRFQTLASWFLNFRDIPVNCP